VCELDCSVTLETLAQNTLIIYIKIPPAMEQTIIERAKSDPKPLYYREAFLDEKLAEFLQLNNYASTDVMPPDEFVTWVFPELFKSRLPRYQAIADQYGFTVDATDVATVKTEDDFNRLIAAALET
ncbi:MAG: ATPase, partial [Methylobacter sp.]|nr:ATPase [Methylobacter sp.]